MDGLRHWAFLNDTDWRSLLTSRACCFTGANGLYRGCAFFVARYVWCLFCSA
jgi:hypothetical protein